MNRKGWIISDIIISITLILMFVIPLVNIYKATYYHINSEETNQSSIELLENSIKTINDLESSSFPMIINNEKFEIEVNEMVSNNARIQKLSIEIRQKSSEFIHSFYFYKEVEDEI
ncbi:hypothetical protein [Acetoanaerobium noterae]|uniref:hypothetical protein n=1 Tax=Acetoanaerobium noterae TaxID=745369 RepID=UPI0028A6B6BD|nr:hypothetical protein [Acetoanaerobium noterae]